MRRIFKLCLVTVCCFLAKSIVIEAQWKNVKYTAITFKIKNAGIGVDGKFAKVNAVVFIDESDPTKSSFMGTADANTISTGIKLRDNHLKEKEEFFYTSNYPIVSMKSVKVLPKSSGLYTVTWDLTMKGVTRRFTSDVSSTIIGTELQLNAQFKINRNDWKLGGNSMTMADIVTVKLMAVLTK
jgi:polyisoprenoid-binding protein YceI